MADRRRLAVVGLGRIGRVHAQHAKELAEEEGLCELVALVDRDLERARDAAHSLRGGGDGVEVFASVEDLLSAGLSDATVVCTPTENHREHATSLLEGGHRVLLEKPLTASLEDDRAFTHFLNETHPRSLMLAFQRRFDEPLQYVRDLLEQDLIGTPFKVVSVLEDSQTPPEGYQSPGLLLDMAVHNVDEILWLTGAQPAAAAAIGSRVFSQAHSPVKEDFDDAFLQIWFQSGMTAQVQVGRNHVAGYRIETWVYGDKGTLHIGRFTHNELEVQVEAYGPGKQLAGKRFVMRDYGNALPEFATRFGPAYKAELSHFLGCCQSGEPFGVDHNDGLRAMETIASGMRCLTTKETAAPLARKLS